MGTSDAELRELMKETLSIVNDITDKSRVGKALSTDVLKESTEANLEALEQYHDIIVQQGANVSSFEVELAKFTEAAKNLQGTAENLVKVEAEREELVSKHTSSNAITNDQFENSAELRAKIEGATTHNQIAKITHALGASIDADISLSTQARKYHEDDLKTLKASIAVREAAIKSSEASTRTTTKFNKSITGVSKVMDEIIKSTEVGYNRTQAYDRLQGGQGLMGTAKGYFSDVYKNSLSAGRAGGAFSESLIKKGGITGFLTKQMSGSLGSMLGSKAFGVAGMIGKYIFDQAKQVDKSAGGFAKMYGTSYQRGIGYVSEGTQVKNGLSMGFADAKDALENAKTIFTASEHLNLTNFEGGRGMVTDTAAMRNRLGFNGAEASKYQVMSMLFGDDSTDTHMKDLGKAVQSATKGMVSYKTIVEDVGKLSKEQILNFGDYNKAMLQSTKALGMGLNAAIAQKTGMGYYNDIPGMIKKSMTSQIISGSSSGNINKALQYSMNDQFVEAVNEMMGDITNEDFKGMKSFQKKVKADSVGLSVGQLGQSLRIKELIGEKSTEELEQLSLKDTSNMTAEEKEAVNVFKQMNDTRSVGERTEDLLKGLSTTVQSILAYMTGDTQAEADADALKEANIKSGMSEDTAESLRDLRAQSGSRIFNDKAMSHEVNKVFSSDGYKNADKAGKEVIFRKALGAINDNDVDNSLEQGALKALKKEGEAQGFSITVNVDQNAKSSTTVTSKPAQVMALGSAFGPVMPQ